MKAGVFLDGVQVGALKNWSLEEKYEVLSQDDRGRPSSQRIIGWTASAVRYLIKRADLAGKELGFKFISIHGDQERICTGKITTEYKTGEAAEGPLEIEGDKAPQIIWRRI